MSNQNSRIIGLTGGIACGKTTVSTYLEQQHHCAILDADRYARNAVSKTSQGLQLIHTRYGSSILNQDGELNRTKLGQIIFQDDREREWIEQLIHPYVRQQLESERTRYLNQQPQSNPPRILVMDIPLLFESNMEDLVTEIWVVTCSLTQQQQRLMARNGLSLSQANRRIQSQWPLQEKIKRTSIILNNGQDRTQLYRQVDYAFIQGG